MTKINNKGQVFVMFVIILPLILLICLVFLKKSYIYYEKTKIENILNLACSSNNPSKIIEKNDKNIEFEINDKDGIIIIAKKKIKDDYLKIKKVCEE